MNLDGKDKITPTPFDAHEQVVRKPHTHSLEHGYQPLKEEPKADEAGEQKAPAAGEQKAAEGEAR